jgi:hypothetical protein
MSNFIELIDRTADRFEQLIVTHCDLLEEIPTEDFGWHNTRWFSRQFRLAHMERFVQPKFSVLHTVIWPHVTDPSAIFGFDIIASDTRATGVFFDFSPTVQPSEVISDQQWLEPRDRPSWGTIFSDHWIACRPTIAEAEQITDLACAKLQTYLTTLGTTVSNRVYDIIQAQNRYSMNQRQNEHTTRVIRRILGEPRGSHFIENILFPTI